MIKKIFYIVVICISISVCTGCHGGGRGHGGWSHHR